MLLGAMGGLAGLVLSQIVVRALLAVLPEIGGNQIEVSADWRIAGWTLLLALAAGALFGIPSAFGMVRGDLMSTLRGDGPAGGPARRSRFRLQSALIATQVAVSAVLLINAGLLLRALGTAAHLNPGLANRNVLIAKVNLRDLQYSPEQAARYLGQFRDLAAVSPGVSEAALTGFEPLMTSCGSRARPIAENGTLGEWVQVSCNETRPEYLRVMQIPSAPGAYLSDAGLRAGRESSSDR